MTETDVRAWDEPPAPLLEALATIEHERWSHWQRYLHGVCTRTARGDLLIPAELVERWERQIATSYADLTDREKESDRTEVRRYWSTIARHSWDGWPDRMEMVRQVREAAGLFAGAMPVTPKQAWEEALDLIRLLRDQCRTSSAEQL